MALGAGGAQLAALQPSSVINATLVADGKVQQRCLRLNWPPLSLQTRGLPWQACNTLGKDVVEDNLASLGCADIRHAHESNTLQQHQILLQRFCS